MGIAAQAMICNFGRKRCRLIRSSAKNSKTDEQLVTEFKKTGDVQCIEILFNRYSHLVFAVSMKYLHGREESKDAVIDIFEKIPDDIRKYQIERFSSWIYTVTRNHCFHLLKKRKGIQSEESIEQLAVEEPVLSTEEADLNQRLTEHLEESLSSLNEEQRTCVSMFYLEEKSYDEIQRATGYSYNQVKSFIQNGKRNLRIYLQRFLK